MGNGLICAHPGCNKPRNATYTMCTMHYQRKFFGKDMDAPEKTPSGSLKRFLEQSLLMETDECIIWPYGKDKDGYAKWNTGAQVYGTNRAYRIVCMRKNGHPPTEVHQAAHSCGRGAEGCINHRHLSWKTPKDNNFDKLAHGTQPFGERTYSAKLTEDQVREVRKMRAQGMTLYAIADCLGVTYGCIQSITSGKTWRRLI